MDLLDAVARNGTSAVEDSVQYIKVMHFAVKHTQTQNTSISTFVTMKISLLLMIAVTKASPMNFIR